MVSINIANFVTIGLIAMIFAAAFNYAMSALGINIPYLSNAA